MIAWIIVALVLMLILMFPIGIDAAYSEKERFVKLKLGPFRRMLFPGTGKKKPKAAKKPKPKSEAQAEEAPKRKRKLTLDDILTLAKIALRALRRFRMHLCIDLLMLRWTAASDDPYRAVVQYGRVNAFLGALSGPIHKTFLILDEDVRTQLDFEHSRPALEGRLVMSIQIWEILLISICAGASGLKWYLGKKREQRAAVGCAGKEPV